MKYCCYNPDTPSGLTSVAVCLKPVFSDNPTKNPFALGSSLSRSISSGFCLSNDFQFKKAGWSLQ